MKKYAFLVIFALTQFSTSAMADTLTYRLLSDSTITARDGSGSSQLEGYFTWTSVFPSQVVDANEFFTTSLEFTSSLYSMTLATNARNWYNSTKIGPNGATIFYADVDLLNSDLNPWMIGAFGSGSYVGSSLAPTEITFGSEVLVPGAGGRPIANLYIRAELVPANVPDGGATMTLVGMAMIGVLALRRKCGQN